MRRLSAAIVLLCSATAAFAAWEVNERGDCVQTWTAGSLLRGPTAILNAPLLPFRSAAGGVVVARDDRSPGTRGKILLPPLLAVAGGGMGLVESIIWIGTGLADTLTGGYFALAPEEATELAVTPVRPALIAEPRRPDVDPCGRSSSRR